MSDIPKSDPIERRKLSDAAKALLEDKAVQAAVIKLRKIWFDELVGLCLAMPNAGSRIEQDRLARLRVLDDVTHILATFIDNERLARR